MENPLSQKNITLTFVLFAVLNVMMLFLGSYFTSFFLPCIAFSAISILIFIRHLGLHQDADLLQEVTKKNETLDSARIEINQLLRLASNKVLITSRSLNEIIWGYEEVFEALEWLIKINVDIQIIVGPTIVAKKSGKLVQFLKKNIENQKIKLFTLKDAPSPHFIIIDNLHIRLEKKHLPDVQEREALIKKNAVMLARRAEIKFNSFKKEATRVIDKELTPIKISSTQSKKE